MGRDGCSVWRHARLCKQRAKGDESEFSLGVQLGELVDINLPSEEKRSKLRLRLMSPQLEPGPGWELGSGRNIFHEANQ